MKKLFYVFITSIIFWIIPSISFAKEQTVTFEYFGRDKCGHCKDLKSFLEKIKPNYPELQIKYHDLETKEGKKIFIKVAEKAQISKTTPIIFIGNTFIQGYRSDETTGLRIIELIKQSLNQKMLTIEDYLNDKEKFNTESVAGGSCSIKVETCGGPEYNNDFIFDIPFIGTVDLKNLSLPFMSLTLGLIDGFNPCAMWVLIMFIALLAQAGSRKRMIQIVGIFMLAETIMYYLILNVWMTTWDFVGLDKFVTPLIGIIAVGAGFFFLWEGWTSDGTCKVTNIEQKRKTQIKIKDIVNSPWTLATFFAVIGLAFSVNIIEFACSIGIPQAFTKILDLNFISWIGKQWYMFLYLITYMIDDIVVFIVAIYSFEKLGVMTKYSKYANLIGGVLMLVIGTIMIIKPELLIF